MGVRSQLIVAGFNVLGATGLHKVVAPLTRGLGVILTFHHVRPDRRQPFSPNRMLEITPEFLDQVIRRLRSQGYDIVTMDEVEGRLTAGRRMPPFAVLTFDDGFRDNLEFALPILERHRAPATFFVATGFPDRNARLWWVELEEAIRKADHVKVAIGADTIDLATRTAEQKTTAFATIYWRLRRGPEEQLLQVIADLCAAHGVDTTSFLDDLCLGWDELARVAKHPLITIGGHTVTHPMLAKHSDERVRAELRDGKAALEERLGRPVRHFAYPVGDPTSACRREFAMTAEAGYATAVTTRPGLLFPAHGSRLTSLPRVSINGNHQSLRNLDVLLSGAPFTLWNKGRRVAPV